MSAANTSTPRAAAIVLVFVVIFVVLQRIDPPPAIPASVTSKAATAASLPPSTPPSPLQNDDSEAGGAAEVPPINGGKMIAAFIDEVMNHATIGQQAGWSEAFLSVKGDAECPGFASSEVPASCPEDEQLVYTWMRLLGKAGKARKTWTVVDVGVNKGYSVVGILSALGVTNRRTKRRLTKADLAVAVYDRAFDENKVPVASRKHLFGHCCDGESDVNVEDVPDSVRGAAPWSGREPHVRVFAYDGAKLNADFVRRYLVDQVGLGDAAVTVKWAAMSHKPGTMTFSGNPFFGSELGRIGSDASGWKDLPKQWRADFTGVATNVTTMDIEFPAAASAAVAGGAPPAPPPRIDVLLTDTEGFDILVAGAARNTLLAGRVGLYIQEVLYARHRVPRLSSLVAALDEAGMSCYFPLEPRRAGGEATTRRFLPISGRCWRAAFDTNGGWYNMVCVNRREPELLAALRDIDTDAATRSSRSKPSQTCDMGAVARRLHARFPERNATWRWAFEGQQRHGAGKRKR
jgi:hypothetical protein